eukprot:gene58227-biopygen44860
MLLRSQRWIAFVNPNQPDPLIPEKGTVRYYVWRIVYSPKFDPTILGVIICNILLQIFQWKGQPDDWTHATDIANLVFLVIYLIEAALKITVLNFVPYIRDSWNRFDFAICVLSVAFVGAGGGGMVVAVRVLRVLRVVRIVNRAKNLKRLFTTLVLSLPPMINIGALCMLMGYIRAVTPIPEDRQEQAALQPAQPFLVPIRGTGRDRGTGEC